MELLSRIPLLLPFFFLSFVQSETSVGVVQDFLHRKCGDADQAIWLFEGSLVDPLDGSRISSVQGLEVVKRIGINVQNPDQFQRRCRDLQVGKLSMGVTPGSTTNASPIASPIGSLFSSKAFCYTQDKNTILSSYSPPRKGAPKRNIPADEALTTTKSVVSVIDAPNDRLLMHTELLQSGSSALGTVNIGEDDANQLELQVFSMPKDLTSQVLEPPKSTGKTPRRSKLIQFGASPANKKSRGAREVYRFTKDGRLRYTRYGEGPVWYGVGRMCQLELTGRRLLPNEKLPDDSLVADLAKSLRLDHTEDQNNKKAAAVEDPVFRYYCDALHPNEQQSSCRDYQRYYDDLSMERTIHHLQQSSKRRSGRGWLERLRAATAFHPRANNNN